MRTFNERQRKLSVRYTLIADEVDVVFPYKAFLAGNKDLAKRLVTTCKQVCGNARLKVILKLECLNTQN